MDESATQCYLQRHQAFGDLFAVGLQLHLLVQVLPQDAVESGRVIHVGALEDAAVGERLGTEEAARQRPHIASPHVHDLAAVHEEDLDEGSELRRLVILRRTRST